MEATGFKDVHERIPSSWRLIRRNVGRTREMTRTGQVCAGSGDASNWPSDLLQLYRCRSGLALLPGTLNVHLSPPVLIASFAQKFAWCGQRILMARCRVNDYPGVIIRTEANELTEHRVANNVLEVASDIHFTTTWELEAGTYVDVEICGN
jgi:CTP-dependent riboflavin kinase